MSIFSTLLAKLSFGKKAQATTPSAPAQAQAPASTPSDAAAPPAPPAPTPISSVDVVAKLETMAATLGEKLNWKVSIVDLLKPLSLDSSLTTRKELTAEHGCPAEKKGDSAQMNMWLHKAVLKKLD